MPGAETPGFVPSAPPALTDTFLRKTVSFTFALKNAAYALRLGMHPASAAACRRTPFQEHLMKQKPQQQRQQQPGQQPTPPEIPHIHPPEPELPPSHSPGPEIEPPPADPVTLPGQAPEIEPDHSPPEAPSTGR